VHDETDETIIRIAAALRPLPEVDPARKASVLVAVAAERERTRERRLRIARAWRVAAGTAAVAAAAFVAAVILGTPRRAAEVPASARSASMPARRDAESVAAAARLATDAKLGGFKTVQVVLRAPSARRVSVVGDFNAWDSGTDEMSRDPVTGLWSHTLALRPGRHVYAFVVDDSVWMRDPRSPEAADADFGRPGSVLLVGQP
jgi:Glycogen recognition site of AMP-activated protein kinase